MTNKRVLIQGGWLYLCFFASGFAGLVYEVVWSRQLALFLGVTTYAHTAVIASYMLGLAAGSFYFGRLADRYRAPLAAYALLEVGIGAYGLLSLWLISGLQVLYAGLLPAIGVSGATAHLWRFIPALLVLLLPTFLMGGTLPLMVRGLVAQRPNLGAMTGRLYGLNTLGATCGAFAAGFLLLPQLGAAGAVGVAAGANALAAVGVWCLRGFGRTSTPSLEKAEPSPRDSDPLPPRMARWILIGYGLSGFASLAAQLAWIRSLILVLGSSVYAFSMTLTTFLAGIGIGSIFYSKFYREGTWRQQLTRAARVEWGIGFTSLLGLPLIGALPGLFVAGYGWGVGERYTTMQAFQFLLCALVMFPPTFLMGLLFPLITDIWSRPETGAGRRVGNVYAANTLGTILGSLTAGLTLLPTFGAYAGLLLASGLQVLIGSGFRWISTAGRTGHRPWAAMVAVLVFAVSAFLLPRWDAMVMNSGPFLYGQNIDQESKEATWKDYAHEKGRLVYLEEGLDGTVAVWEDDSQHFLSINGKVDASSVSDFSTQAMLGHIPAFLHADPKQALVIGLGSGITAGALGAHPGMESIKVLELSPEVVEAAAFFSETNREVLRDPRVEVVVADARNYAYAEKDQFDLIISEPSNPWLSGVSNLFTEDFFRLIKGRLKPDGIMTQWFHMYNMSPEDVRLVMRTFQSKFRHVSVWEPMDNDLVMIGSDVPHQLDLNRFVRLRAMPGIGKDLETAGRSSLAEFAQMFLLSDEHLARYVGDGPLNTDNRQRLEFSAPRNLYTSTTDANQKQIVQHLDDSWWPLPATPLVFSRNEKIEVPFFGFDVVPSAGRTPSEVEAGWNLLRMYIPSASTAVEAVGTGSEGVIRWRETGYIHNTLRMFLAKTDRDIQVLERYLAITLEGRIVTGGRVDLPGSRKGAWVLLQPATDEIIIAVSWFEQALDGATYQLLLQRRRPDPGPDQWGPSLIDTVRSLQPRVDD